MTVHRIEVPDLPPSANQRERRHWSESRADKTKWVEYLAYLGGRRIPKAKPGEKRTVTITLEKGPHGKRDDPGNLPYRSKVILDALVELQIIFDDDVKHLDFDPIRERLGTPHKQTIVEVHTA